MTLREFIKATISTKRGIMSKDMEWLERCAVGHDPENAWQAVQKIRNLDRDIFTLQMALDNYRESEES